MKTREEVEKLKADWNRDPCFDLELYPDFEDYADELLAYRKEQEAEWEKDRQKHHDDLAEKWCPMSFATDKDTCKCEVEKCAWWDEPNDCCVIRALVLK